MQTLTLEIGSDTARVPTDNGIRGFLREQNISFLERALRLEVDPDQRRILRRLLREQERFQAAETGH